MDASDLARSPLRTWYWKRFQHFHRISTESPSETSPSQTRTSLGPSQINSWSTSDTQSTENGSGFHCGCSCAWCKHLFETQNMHHKISAVKFPRALTLRAVWEKNNIFILLDPAPKGQSPTNNIKSKTKHQKLQEGRAVKF